MRQVRPIFISTNCFKERDPDSILRICETNKYRRIELSSVYADEESAMALAHQLRLREVEILLHNYYPPGKNSFTLNLASQDQKMLERSRAFCLRALEISAQLGALHYAAHAGFTMDIPPQLLGDASAQENFAEESFWSKTDCLVTLAESISLLTKHGRRLGVEFLIENHVYATASNQTASPLLLCWEAEEIVRLANMLRGKLGLLVDCGHLKVSAQSGGFSKREFLTRIEPWMRAFHLSDNAGTRDEHRAFDGNAWFLPMLQRHRTVPCTLEFNSVSDDDIRLALHVLQDQEK